MTTTTKSLLHTVRDIEQEADALVLDAKENAAKELHELKQRTNESLDEIQEKAAQTSAAILQEHTQRAQVEAQQILEQSKKVVSNIHTSAEKNREAALEKAKKFFNQEFGTEI